MRFDTNVGVVYWAGGALVVQRCIMGIRWGGIGVLFVYSRYFYLSISLMRLFTMLLIKYGI